MGLSKSPALVLFFDGLVSVDQTVAPELEVFILAWYDDDRTPGVMVCSF